jgi:hypothetical protein
MLGTCADPPSLGDSLPLHKAGELGCAFLPLLGYRPHAVVPYARECIEPTATLGHTGIPRPARPGRTHVRRVRRRHRGDAATTPDDAISRADPHVGTQNVSLF